MDWNATWCDQPAAKTVRLGLAFPTCGNAAGWPDGSFGNDGAALNGVQARVVSLSSLRVDKSEHRDDPVVAAKDHADLETLAELS